MKVWQLFSVARDQEEVIGDVASKNPSWSRYLDIARSFDVLVDQQRRDVLDSEVDDGFRDEVAQHLSKPLYLSGRWLRARRHSPFDRRLTILEAVRRFGGETVEDAFEYGMVDIEGR